MNKHTITIDTEFIRLDALLKLGGAFETVRKSGKILDITEGSLPVENEK
mgnify:CR=1 FL=1